MRADQLPLTPSDCDLRGFPFLPIDIARLFGSAFHALASDSEWRAGVTLWLKSFHQVPAASLPDDDVALARLAELGRDLKTWKKLRARALHGWVKCSDGRLYHPVVAEKVHDAWKGKQTQRARTCKARITAFLTRLSKPGDSIEFAHIESLVTEGLKELRQYLSQAEYLSFEQSVTDSVAETKRKREGKGEGKREGKGCVYSAPSGTGGVPPAITPHLPNGTTGEQNPRAEQLAAIMRDTHGMKAANNASDVLEMASLAVSDQEIAEAVEMFKGLKPGEKPNVGYIHQMILSARRKAAKAGAASGKHAGSAQASTAMSWWLSPEGVRARGTELGLTQREDKGELPRQFRVRVLKTAGPGPWQDEYLKEISREAAEHERVLAHFNDEEMAE